MDVDLGGAAESSPVKAVGVGIAVAASGGGSVSVSLHPLVIMNVSEHWTRRTAQEGKPVHGGHIIIPNNYFNFCQFFI